MSIFMQLRNQTCEKLMTPKKRKDNLWEQDTFIVTRTNSKKIKVLDIQHPTQEKLML